MFQSEVYCRRRSGNFWRMQASLGLACVQAATLGTQVVGRPGRNEAYVLLNKCGLCCRSEAFRVVITLLVIMNLGEQRVGNTK